MKDNVIEQIARIDQIVHNPARLMIILLLSKQDSLDYLELMELTSLTSGNITTHLAKLAAGGYIRIKKSFKGKKPHTKLVLTEAGRCAYSKWASAIALALPESAQQQIVARRMPKSAEPKPCLLGYNDFYQTDSQYLASLPEHLLRGFFRPPVQIPSCM
jgi:DNA-binding MarR family transcriptional regulator